MIWITIVLAFIISCLAIAIGGFGGRWWHKRGRMPLSSYEVIEVQTGEDRWGRPIMQRVPGGSWVGRYLKWRDKKLKELLKKEQVYYLVLNAQGQAAADKVHPVLIAKGEEEYLFVEYAIKDKCFKWWCLGPSGMPENNEYGLARGRRD